MAQRTEVVRLTLEDDFTSKMARAAAEAAKLDKALGGIDGQNVRVSKSTDTVTQSITRQGSAFQRQSASINQFSGRLRLLTEAAVIGGPAFVALGAAAIPAVTGLAAAFGFAAVGAGTLVAGFQGVGTAFEAVNKAQLEPTAENLEAARVALEQLSPAARSMVGELDRLSPALIELRDASAEGIAPQMARGVDELLVGLPKLRGFFEETAGAAASVLADGVGVLNADRWQPFLRFVEDEAPSAILQLGRITGDLSFGFAELFRNMAPINADVLNFLEGAADKFAQFSSGLEGSEGLRDFFAYLRETGPQVGEALGAMANAILQIAQAGAPLSGPVLSAIEGVSNAIAAIAGSDAGAPLFAMAAGALALNRALKITTALAAAPAVGALFGTGAAAGAAGRGGALAASGAGGPIALGVTAAAIASSPVSDLINQAKGYDGLKVSLEELGTTLRTGDLPEGFGALGEATRFLSDRNGFESATDDINRFFDMSIGKLKESDDLFAGLDSALSDIAAQDGPEAASRAFERLAKNAGLSREEMGLAKEQLPGFADAVGSQSMGTLLNVFENLPGAISSATAEINEFKLGLVSAQEVLENRATRRDYEASLDAATAALRENGRTLDITTEKGRANAASLDAIAVSAVSVAKGLKGAAKVEFLQGARAQFVDLAQDMGKSASSARRLADNLGLIKPVRAKVDIIDGAAKTALKAIESGLENVDGLKANPQADLNTTQFTSKQRRALNDVGVLDRQKPTPTANLNDGPFQSRQQSVMQQLGLTDSIIATPTANLQDNASGPARSIQAAIAAIQSKTVTITTIQRTVNSVQNVVSRIFRADGGPVVGPGGPRDDAVPAMLSNGEFVVNAAATSRNRALLESINAQKMADGGFVRPQPVPAAAVPMRPMGGAARQLVSVGFDGPAEVTLRMPDGSTQMARIAARVTNRELRESDRFDRMWADD